MCFPLIVFVPLLAGGGLLLRAWELYGAPPRPTINARKLAESGSREAG